MRHHLHVNGKDMIERTVRFTLQTIVPDLPKDAKMLLVIEGEDSKESKTSAKKEHRVKGTKEPIKALFRAKLKA